MRGRGAGLAHTWLTRRTAAATTCGRACFGSGEYDGGMTVAKVAVTVPEETLRAVEKRRRFLGMSRSAVVSAALESWLADQAMTAEERRYVVAYMKQPETVEEVRETTAIGSAAMAGWDCWTDTPTHAPAAKRPATKRTAGRTKRSKAKR